MLLSVAASNISYHVQLFTDTLELKIVELHYHHLHINCVNTFISEQLEKSGVDGSMSSLGFHNHTIEAGQITERVFHGKFRISPLKISEHNKKQ